MKFKIACPECATVLVAREKHVGRKLSCPKCKHKIEIKAPTATKPDVAPLDTLESLPPQPPSTPELVDLTPAPPIDLNAVNVADPLATGSIDPLLGTPTEMSPLDAELGALNDIDPLGGPGLGSIDAVSDLGSQDLHDSSIAPITSPLGQTTTLAGQQPKKTTDDKPSPGSQWLIPAIIVGVGVAVSLCCGGVATAIWMLMPGAEDASPTEVAVVSASAGDDSDLPAGTPDSSKANKRLTSVPYVSPPDSIDQLLPRLDGSVPALASAGESREPPPLDADKRVATLYDVMSGFAINPRTGDVAAVTRKDGRAYLFRHDAIQPGTAVTFSHEVNVGDIPRAIAFKRYHDTEVFVVGTFGASHVTVIGASDFKPLGNVPTRSTSSRGTGPTEFVASQNPEDPYLYYKQRDWGVIDIRTLTNCGKLPIGGKGFALASDGRRGFTGDVVRIEMNRGFESPTPTFDFRFLQDVSHDKPPLLCSPEGYDVITGETIYSGFDQQELTRLDIAPRYVMPNKPVLLGLDDDQLQAFSLTTLARTGKPIQLPESVTAEEPDSVPPYLRDSIQGTVLLDSVHDRLLYAIRDKVAVLNTTDLDLPDEPSLAPALTTAKLVVGQQQSIALHADPRVSVQVGDLPPGASKTNDGFAWQPKESDIDRMRVPVTLKFGEVERKFECNVRVSRPFIDAGITANKFVIDTHDHAVVCWTDSGSAGRPAGQREAVSIVPLSGQQSPMAWSTTDATEFVTATQTLIAVVPRRKNEVRILSKQLKPRGTIETADLPTSIAGNATRLAIAEKGKSQIDVYDTNTLQKVGSIRTNWEISELTFDNGELLAAHRGGAKTYCNIMKMKQTRLDQAPQTGSNALRDGRLVADCVLYDLAGKTPQLLVDPNPCRFGVKPPSYILALLRKAQRPKGVPSRLRSAVPIPDKKISVAVKFEQSNKLVDGVFTQALSLQVIDSLNRDVATVPIVVEHAPRKYSDSCVPRIVGTQVYVAFGSEIFHWDAADIEVKETVEDAEPEPLYFIPQQSTFVIDMASTTLKHEVGNARGASTYQLKTAVEGLSINAATGDVTVDRAALLSQARAKHKSLSNEKFTEYSRKIMSVMPEPMLQLLGSKPAGIPVAFPIHLEVADASGQKAETAYFVLIVLTSP